MSIKYKVEETCDKELDRLLRFTIPGFPTYHLGRCRSYDTNYSFISMLMTRDSSRHCLFYSFLYLVKLWYRASHKLGDSNVNPSFVCVCVCVCVCGRCVKTSLHGRLAEVGEVKVQVSTWPTWRVGAVGGHTTQETWVALENY